HSSRALALAKLQRHSEAVADWDRAATLDAGPDRPYLRLQRSLALVRAGQAGAAVAEVEQVTTAAKVSGADLYAAACVLALASAAAKAEAPLAERRAAGAVALLRRAKDAGHFRDPKKVAHLQQDSDLHSLRQRPDFQQFVAELEKK